MDLHKSCNYKFNFQEWIFYPQTFPEELHQCTANHHDPLEDLVEPSKRHSRHGSSIIVHVVLVHHLHRDSYLSYKLNHCHGRKCSLSLTYKGFQELGKLKNDASLSDSTNMNWYYRINSIIWKIWNKLLLYSYLKRRPQRKPNIDHIWLPSFLCFPCTALRFWYFQSTPRALFHLHKGNLHSLPANFRLRFHDHRWHLPNEL